MSALDGCYNIFDMREAAKRRLPRGIFEFVDRATEDHLAVTDNRAGFQDIKLRHRALVCLLYTSQHYPPAIVIPSIRTIGDLFPVALRSRSDHRQLGAGSATAFSAKTPRRQDARIFTLPFGRTICQTNEIAASPSA